jgi:hypothetical protein
MSGCGCDEFKVAIEMSSRGALSREQADELAAHLTSCQACRDFQALKRSMEEAMDQTVRSFADDMDWDRIRDRVQKTVGTYRRTTPLIAVCLVASASIPLVLEWVRGGGHYSDVLLSYFAAVPFMVAAMIWVNHRVRTRVRELSEAERTKDDLIAAYRRSQDQQIRDLRFSRVFHPILFVTMVVVIPAAFGSVPLHLIKPVNIATVLVAIVWAVYCHRAVARLRRERAELD